MVILTNEYGREERPLEFKKFDCDLNDTKDFELTVDTSSYEKDMTYGRRIFIPNTEYGGIIGEIKTLTKSAEVHLKGKTWRGFLDSKIIVPTGNYKIVSGELNEVIGRMLEECGMAPTFQAREEDTGVSVTNYQFNRYCRLYSGLVKMLESEGYRLDIEYIQGEKGVSGHIEVGAVPIEDYSGTLEYSSDNQLSFEFSQTVNKCNHLICLGAGQLSGRQKIDLYINPAGEVVSEKYYTGLNEVVDVYDYPNVEGETASEQLANLRKAGTEKLLELTNTQSMEMSVDSLDQKIGIGDIIGGRDYITKMSMSKPIENKIYTEEEGKITIKYEVKGDDNEEETIIQ